ncbi:MAG: Spo0B domain-containing protein [Clostridiales bacterium]|nr:Spo0B domain-containing protein [Clostridiales bacterium]
MKVKAQVNIRKAAVYSIVINALQIVAVVVLAVYILADGVNSALQGMLGDIVVLALAAVVSWGAAVDISEAYKAGKLSFKLRGLNETVTQMSDLNVALRVQRHDFLNHLQVVYSLIEMREYDEANRYIEQVYGDIQSVSQALKTACAPVNALLRAKIAEAEQRGIRVELSVHAVWDALPVPAWEMCRVLSNLIDNAMDALQGRPAPHLCIDLAEDVKQFAFEIKNNGPAIPEKNLTRIFEPGFSGKGEGRGMGLHIARETMRQAGGDLTVESSDAFTAFRGTLPKSIKPVEEEAP